MTLKIQKNLQITVYFWWKTTDLKETVQKVNPVASVLTTALNVLFCYMFSGGERKSMQYKKIILKKLFQFFPLKHADICQSDDVTTGLTTDQAAALLNSNRCGVGAQWFVSVFSFLLSSFLSLFFPLWHPPLYLSFSILSFPVFLSVSWLLILFCSLSHSLSHLVQLIRISEYFLQKMQIS